MHTRLMRDLLHEFSNKLTALKGSLDCVLLGDIDPGPTRESILLAQKSTNELCSLLSKANDLFYEYYRQKGTTPKHMSFNEITQISAKPHKNTGETH